jgi:hypothetical protein
VSERVSKHSTVEKVVFYGVGLLRSKKIIKGKEIGKLGSVADNQPECYRFVSTIDI